MNKKVFTILTILCLGFIQFVSAREISQQEAEKVAKNFFYELKANENLSYHQITIVESFSTFKEGEIVYYAFNFENGGFVIVAADDTYQPVIGYSDKNVFRTEDTPENVTAWMNNYADDVLTVRNSKAPSKFLDKWNHLLSDDYNTLQKGTREDVVFLDCAIWNQDAPYNYYAPSTPNGSGPDGRCYAGCVATAMEMCMNYWRWPFTGEGSKSYFASSYSNDPNCPHPLWTWGTLSANFADSYYDWYGTAHEPGNMFYKDISYLMYHCGISVNMNFDPCGSGAQTSEGANALKNNFKYATNIAYQNRGNSTTWINVLKEELDNGRMICYSGHSSSGGHAFVCDGYNTDNYFHFNFGWSGSEDGYYLVTTGPNGYTESQGIIKNMQPNPNKGYPYYCEGHTVITHVNGSIEDGSGPIENYLDNTNASWLIDPSLAGDSVSSIVVSFKGGRKMELGAGDFLKIYDGENENATLLRTFMGNSIHNLESVTATSGKVFITFTSDGAGTGNGFHIEFKGTTKKFCTGNNMVSTYSGTINDGSPEDMNYSNNTNCMYIFNNDLTLNWIEFSFNRCRLAEGDYIIFRKENTIMDTIQGIYEDNELPLILRYENINTSRISFTFITNNKFNDKGWELNFITDKTAIEEFEAVTDLSVYPNPATKILNINFQTEKTSNLGIKLYSITGQLIYNDNLTNFSGNYNNTVNVNDLTAGIYLLNISTDKGISTRKVVIQ